MPTTRDSIPILVAVLLLAGGTARAQPPDRPADNATAPVVVRAGATVLVAATAVFGEPEGPAAAVHRLLASAGAPG